MSFDFSNIACLIIAEEGYEYIKRTEGKMLDSLYVGEPSNTARNEADCCVLVIYIV